MEDETLQCMPREAACLTQTLSKGSITVEEHEEGLRVAAAEHSHADRASPDLLGSIAHAAIFEAPRGPAAEISALLALTALLQTWKVYCLGKNLGNSTG